MFIVASVHASCVDKKYTWFHVARLTGISPHAPYAINNMITTALTDKLGLRVPLVMGGMQWVGTPKLAVSVTNAGALGIMTALTQPSPEVLKNALVDAQKQVYPDIAAERKDKFGSLGVNITLLPAISPPDYPAYARAALEAGIRIFETAGNNRG